MTHVRMHADELDIDDALVRALLRAQLPQWADLPLERVVSSGTDNAMFRLGGDMVVRLPRIGWAVAAVEKEHQWLQVLAPRLPLPVPAPLAKGEPGAGYPWPWSVYEWIEGENAFNAPISDLAQAARDVAGFIKALQGIDPTDGPRAMPGRRGTALAGTDEQTRRAIASTRELVDVAAVTAAWDAALRTPEWARDPVWFHGDVARGNLLVRDGRIRAVIDFGTMAVGDPACDLIVAWDLFDVGSRQVLKAELAVDDDTWDRGRGWALSTAVNVFTYYLHTNPVMVAQARHKLAEVLADEV